ncbi:hypothetical protein HGP28_18780 [Vibrio sp. SM6]|uniref:Uncharacterized protein n=1 Tax=Vibrio agarilyticus TaxID=2726741 RepID=A0A7X8YIS9_9VIBR|nr:hypothetical protein [Vibrio agarilyticus]NLS14906.1 hypothetical protein [Vibrio agarilyticus]
MNFRDPELILEKRFRGGKCSYYQVASISRDEIALKDIVQGGQFVFMRRNLEAHIQNGVLKQITKADVPSALFVEPVSKKAKARQSARQLDDEREMERRYQYVRAVLDEVPAYTQKRLEPWLIDATGRFDDPSPPCWRTVSRWVSIFIESGWKKNSLRPGHTNKGNRAVRVDPIVIKLLEEVVKEHCLASARINYTKAHKDFVSRLEKINDKRVKDGLTALKPTSYGTTVNRFKN